jgi:hypothetical protein
MATAVKFLCFVEDLAEQKHDLSSDDLKLALSNTAPTNTDTVFAPGSAHPPPASANGYTSGGESLTVTASGQSGGTYTLAADAVVFTASGGQLGPVRYAILYNNTATNDEVALSWDRGASVTLETGETLTVTFGGDPTGGSVLTIA